MSSYAAESPRLYLQALDLSEHLDVFYAIHSNELCMKWSSKAVFTDLAHTKQVMQEEYMPSLRKPWTKRYIILLKNESDKKPTPIGLVGVVTAQDVSYKLLPEFWGQGFMTEALGMFIEMYWASERHSFREELIAVADLENLASLRVLEKLGFRKSIVLRNRFLYPYFASRGEEKLANLQAVWLPRPGTEP